MKMYCQGCGWSFSNDPMMAQPSACPECGAMMFASWPKGEIFPALVAPFYGATCGICGFRYAEHEGHIIPCPRCVVERLKEEKAQIDACAAQWARENAALVDRLTQAEAREAAMRGALQGLYRAICDYTVPERDAELLTALETVGGKAEAALSPVAGRALAAEVEALRDVARAAKVFSKLNIEHLRDWPNNTELWDCCGTMLRVGHVRALRYALAQVRGEEGE